MPDKFNNKKILSFLTYEFPFISTSVFYKSLRKKDIRINNTKISENILIHTGDEIKLFISDNFFEISPDIIYEDENILVVNKQKGIEVTGENSITSILQKYRNFIFPCHRLDRNTTRSCHICKIK